VGTRVGAGASILRAGHRLRLQADADKARRIAVDGDPAGADGHVEVGQELPLRERADYPTGLGSGEREGE